MRSFVETTELARSVLMYGANTRLDRQLAFPSVMIVLAPLTES
jgi:hypothetical protein